MSVSCNLVANTLHSINESQATTPTIGDCRLCLGQKTLQGQRTIYLRPPAMYIPGCRLLISETFMPRATSTPVME